MNYSVFPGEQMCTSCPHLLLGFSSFTSSPAAQPPAKFCARHDPLWAPPSGWMSLEGPQPQDVTFFAVRYGRWAGAATIHWLIMGRNLSIV